MTKNRNSKQYDLEDRTLKFAKNVRSFVMRLPKTIGNIEDGKRLINASGYVRANYIEANEALSKKDFIMRNCKAEKRGIEERTASTFPSANFIPDQFRGAHFPDEPKT